MIIVCFFINLANKETLESKAFTLTGFNTITVRNLTQSRIFLLILTVSGNQLLTKPEQEQTDRCTHFYLLIV